MIPGSEWRAVQPVLYTAGQWVWRPNVKRFASNHNPCFYAKFSAHVAIAMNNSIRS